MERKLNLLLQLKCKINYNFSYSLAHIIRSLREATIIIATELGT